VLTDLHFGDIVFGCDCLKKSMTTGKMNMETVPNKVDKNLQFAYETCRDNNAYTSKKTVCEIVTEGTASLREDKVEFAYSVFPELRQK
jgi:hypothetical protein